MLEYSQHRYLYERKAIHITDSTRYRLYYLCATREILARRSLAFSSKRDYSVDEIARTAVCIVKFILEDQI